MKHYYFLILFALCSIGASAQFSGRGSGTADDPYQITNADELYEIRGDLNASYRLMYDIDLTEWIAENNPSGGWIPIGNKTTPFKGSIDGNNKTLTFSINQSSLEMAGFISYTSYATIKDLNIVGNVIAYSGGGLIGYCGSSHVTNCTFRGCVSCISYAGGLIGESLSSEISKCSAAVELSGLHCGGISATSSYSTHEECSVWGIISANYKENFYGQLGGIAGTVNGKVQAGTFKNCYFNGIFSGTIPEFAGGIVGEVFNGPSKAVITNCIVIAPEIKGKMVGGIAASSSVTVDCISDVAIVDCIKYADNNGYGYGIGRVSSVYDGSNKECLAFAGLSIMKESSTVADNIVRSGNNGVPIGKTLLTKSSTYLTHGFDMSVWVIDEGIDYPYLACAKKFKSNSGNNSGSNIPNTDISKLTDVIYINNAEASAGSQLTLSVNMKNTVTAEGFGFDLYLPDGVTIATDEDGFPMVELSTERTTARKTNSFDAAFQSDGSLRVLAASTNGSAINGNDGEVCRVMVNIANNMAPGDYAVLLKNIAISDVDAVSHRIDQVKLTLTIVDYTPGDGNGDGVIDVSDFTATAHYLLGNAPTGFNVKAADANGDGIVDVADLTAVAHIILYGSVNRPNTAPAYIPTNPQ